MTWSSAPSSPDRPPSCPGWRPWSGSSSTPSRCASPLDRASARPRVAEGPPGAAGRAARARAHPARPGAGLERNAPGERRSSRAWWSSRTTPWKSPSSRAGALEILDARTTERPPYAAPPCSRRSGGHLLVRVAYDRRRFDGSRAVGRLLGHLRALLERDRRAPDCRIGAALDPRPPSASSSSTVNDTAFTQPEAAACPTSSRPRSDDSRRDRPCFRGGCGHLPRARSAGEPLARALAELAAWDPRCWSASASIARSKLIVALYAVLKAGGAYVPLDPAAPADRLAQLLGEVRGAAHAGRRAAAPGDCGRGRAYPGAPGRPSSPCSWTTSGLPGLLPGPSARSPPPGWGRRALAYVIYTSGSTGAPKGVMVRHRRSSPPTSWRASPGSTAWAPGTASSSASALSFDPSVEEIFALPGARRARLVLRPTRLARPARLPRRCSSATG